MQHRGIVTNSVEAWLLAARPKTLAGAAVPVMMALALAWYDLYTDTGTVFCLRVVPAVLCVLFAFIMQIDANFINDYFDFRRGTDGADRLGPERACAMGWVTPTAMLWAIAMTTLLASLVGMPLIFYGGTTMFWIGLACVVFCFLYTLGMSYIGLGDVLVLLFFGLVPVCATYYLQALTVSVPAVVGSLACGLVIDTLLVVNNYRDRDTDRVAGKRTLVVMIGERASEMLYLGLGVVAFLLGLVFLFNGRWLTFSLPTVYLVLHFATYLKLKRINRGRQLNDVLGENARNMFVFGLLFTVGTVADALLF